MKPWGQSSAYERAWPDARRSRRLVVLLATLVGLALASPAAAAPPAAARAAASSDTVSLSASSYAVDAAHQRTAVITVVRSDPRGTEQVRYGWASGRPHFFEGRGFTAKPRIAYTPTEGTCHPCRLDMADGQRTATFAIPVHADPGGGIAVTLAVHIYGIHPGHAGDPDRAVVTIRSPVAALPRDQLNPLALSPAPAGANPLQGAKLFAGRHTLARRTVHRLRHKRPRAAKRLEVIADQPEVQRFGAWDDRSGRNPAAKVTHYLRNAHHEDPAGVPQISTYRLRHPKCDRFSDSPAQERSFDAWYDNLARAIGAHRVIVYLELDGLITVQCLNAKGRAARVRELSHAIGALAPLPHVVVYVDAGAADSKPARQMANWLARIGAQRIQGFFVNWSHYDFTKREIRYAHKIAGLLRSRGLPSRPGATPAGGTHAVISTALGGRGPLVPHNRRRYGNEIRCAPVGRGLGPKPTTDTGFAGIDAFAWIAQPGRGATKDDPACRRRAPKGVRVKGRPDGGGLWVKYALMLVRNAHFRVRR